MNGLVSIIVPTYNRAYCLARTIDSALAQTYRNLEVLIIDDGSTDDTRALVETRYGNEPRVRYIFQENQGVSVARNTGIEAVRGEFAALLDSDDVWYPWKLEAQIAALRAFPEVGMVWTDMEAIDPAGTVFDPRHLRTIYHAYRQFRDEDLFTTRVPLKDIAPGVGTAAEGASVLVGEIFTQMVVGNLVHTSTVVMRTEVLKKVGLFKPELRFAGEDYDFHLRTCREAPVALIDASAIQYQRGLADHISREDNKVHLAINFLNALAPVLENDRDRIKMSDAEINRIVADAHDWIGEKALNAGDLPLARKHLATSLRMRRRNARSMGLLALTCLPFRLDARLRSVFKGCKSLIRPAAAPAHSA